MAQANSFVALTVGNTCQVSQVAGKQ